jgi:predicted SAM-dependent methyltransferase
MHDLFGVPNDTVAAVYASHILEHNAFGNGMLEATLAEWHRVLRPGALLLVSVPDLRTLAGAEPFSYSPPLSHHRIQPWCST